MEQQSPGSAQKAKQGTDATGGERRELWWAEATIWTDRMVLALGRACPCEGARGVSHLIPVAIREAVRDGSHGTVPYPA
jgi:hypothetical protein